MFDDVGRKDQMIAILGDGSDVTDEDLLCDRLKVISILGGYVLGMELHSVPAFSQRIRKASSAGSKFENAWIGLAKYVDH